MAAPSSSASKRNAREQFVSDWEELPEGEWLDNDEDMMVTVESVALGSYTLVVA